MATQNESEVEADRKAAEDSGCAVTLRSNNASCSEKDKSNERPVEEETKGRGRGQAWGRRRPRGPRTRPHGHFAQGSQRDNSAAELLPSNDSDRFVATGFDQSADQFSSPCNFNAGQPPEGSHLLPHGSSQPQYGGQESGEGHRGQRSAGGRGHPRPKYVTVPDASRSNDVRHVEQVNDSIVINIDRSARPAPEPVRRGGRGGRGGERGTGARGDFSVGTPDDDASPQGADRDFGAAHGAAAPNRSGYRGQGARRPFRGQGDGSYRGQGRGDGGYWRARGDGPRPFRSGYRGDRARGGRGARRAVIHVSTASSGSAVGSTCARDEEDWDRDASADAGDSAAFAGEGNGAATHQEERENPGETEDGGAGHFFDSSPASGVDDHEDGVDAVSRTRKSRLDSELDAQEKTECVVEKKEVERNVETAEGKQELATGVEGCDSEAGSKALATGLEGAKSQEGAEREQSSTESAKAGVPVKADIVEASCGRESCADDQVVGKASENASDETADASKKPDLEKPLVQRADATGLNSSTVSNSNELKTAPPASAEISNSSVPSTASDKDSPVLSSDVASEIPTASADRKT